MDEEDCPLARAIRFDLVTPSGRTGHEIFVLILKKMAKIPAHKTWEPPKPVGRPPGSYSQDRRRPPGRARGPQRRRATTKAPPILCPKGHAFTAWNTYWHPRGPRCRECINAANREWRRRQRSEV